MSNTAQSQIMQIDRRLRKERDALRKAERKLEKEVDSQGLRLNFGDASRAKDELRKVKRQLKEAENKCSECSVWLRQAGSSDLAKQENAVKKLPDSSDHATL